MHATPPIPLPLNNAQYLISLKAHLHCMHACHSPNTTPPQQCSISYITKGSPPLYACMPLPQYHSPSTMLNILSLKAHLHCMHVCHSPNTTPPQQCSISYITKGSPSLYACMPLPQYHSPSTMLNILYHQRLTSTVCMHATPPIPLPLNNAQYLITKGSPSLYACMPLPQYHSPSTMLNILYH